MTKHIKERLATDPLSDRLLAICGVQFDRRNEATSTNDVALCEWCLKKVNGHQAPKLTAPVDELRQCRDCGAIFERRYGCPNDCHDESYG